MVPVRTIRVLERVRRTCLLGVRFWDPLTQTFIADGLVVTAAPVGRPQARRTAIANRRGGYVFDGLPGLRDLEIGDDPGPDRVPSPPGTQEFDVRVDDPLERFIPIQFRAAVPTEGWVSLACEAAPTGRPPDSIPLFSSPARHAGGRLAVVRADLWYATADRPAAWAVLEIRVTTPGGVALARGLSDENGRVMAAFTYPEMTPPPAPVSPPAPRTGLTAQTWELDLSVRFAALPGTRRRLHDLCVILGQAQGTMILQESPVQPLTRGTLLYGQELVLRTSGDAQGRLLVLPG